MQYKLSPSAKLLKELRIARSLSQDALAEAIGTNANTISRWERGVASPSLYYRRKLAELFEIDPQELLSDPNDGEKSPTGYVNIDLYIIPDHQEGNSYLVTASTTARKKDAVSERFSFSPRTWQSLEPIINTLRAIDQNTRDDICRIHKLGEYLFNCLFSGKVRQFYDNKRQDAINTSKTLRLRLILVPLDLVVLPWELLFDERYSEYLCLTQQPKTVLIRSIEGVTHKKDNSPKYDPPLRILGVMADPSNLLWLQSEKKIVEEALQELITDKKVDLEWKPGRISELDDLPYSTDRLDVFHFIGHAHFDETNRQGQLVFEDEKRHSKFISTERLQASLHPMTKLIVLDACETARGNRFDRLSNIAHGLASQKIPAVVATQFHIPDTASNRFSKIFYMLLAKGIPVDEAVAEARREIHKTAEDQDRLDWAAPILYISSPNIVSFKADPKPIAVAHPLVAEQAPVNLLPLPDSDTETIIPPSEQTIEINPSIVPPDEPASPRDPSRPPFNYKIARRSYIALASIIIVLLILGAGIFPLLSFLSKPPPDLFPALCRGNFQSTNTTIVPTPATTILPDGESIGLSEGATIFDLDRSDVQYKLQAAQDATNNPQDVVSSLKNALSIDPTDAEAKIYLENWRVLGSNHPHIKFVVGVSFPTSSTTASHNILQSVSFASSSTAASRGLLQGAYTAQKECNDQSQQDESKTQIVLMIANVGGTQMADRANNATFVAKQMADQTSKDPTIAGIMGWLSSADTINVKHQLRLRGSDLPMISPSASSDELQGMSNFFRVCPPNKEEAKLAAKFLLNSQHKKKIAILYDATTSYGNNLKDDFAQNIPHNMVASLEPFIGGQSDTIQNALNQALTQNPDAMYFSGYLSDLVGLLKDISSTSSANLLIVGGDALASTNSYPNPLPDLHNVYFTAFASPNEWQGTNVKPPFFKDYQNNFGTNLAPTNLPSIDATVMLGYDATLALLRGSEQVLSKQKTITPPDLTQALKQITVANPIQGVTGRIAFKDNGDPQEKKVILEHIQKTNLEVDNSLSQGCLRITDKCGP